MSEFILEGLRAIHISGLCSLADTTLCPGHLTILISANGSGKSNILRAFRIIERIRTHSLQRFVAESGGASTLLHYGPKRTPTINLRLDFFHKEELNVYQASLGYASGDRLMFLDESVGVQGANDTDLQLESLGTGHWESELRSSADIETVKTLDYWLSQLTFFHFHDTSMNAALRTHARLEDDRFLRSDGSNLAAYLYRLSRSDSESENKAWRRINQFVSRIAPALKELAPTLVNESTVRLDWIDDQDERFGVHQLSDGTLRAIALITALGQPINHLPKFLSIDEPELGLHPAAIGLLAELARSVSRHTQVLFATQSTAFLDYFDPSEVVVVERENGASQLHGLDALKLSSWLEDYTLSEVFDKGVIGGRP